MVDASVNVPENAPLGCPGTLNENSGRALPCQGCPNQQACLTAPKGPDPDISIIREKLEGIRFRILILSGKGGVGKSTFSVNLAYALAADPDVAVSIYCVSERLAVFLTELEQVGLLDVDLSGPSIPQMCGLKKEVVHFSNSGWSTVGVSDNLSVMSIGFLLDEVDGSVIWRGDRKNGLIKQFLRDVDWGKLDYMIVDTPPGTSDEHLTISKYLKDSNTFAVIITTPQELSLQDVRKEISFCRKIGIPIIGIVENMSIFICPNCNYASEIFDHKTGGAEKMCKDLSLPFLGSVPLEPEVARSCDEGEQYTDFFPETLAYKEYLKIAEGPCTKVAQIATKLT